MALGDSALSILPFETVRYMGEESQLLQPGNRESSVLVLLRCSGAQKSITVFPRLQFLQPCCETSGSSVLWVSSAWISWFLTQHPCPMIGAAAAALLLLLFAGLGFSETGPWVDQAGFNLTMKPRITLKFWFPPPLLPKCLVSNLVC